MLGPSGSNLQDSVQLQLINWKSFGAKRFSIVDGVV